MPSDAKLKHLEAILETIERTRTWPDSWSPAARAVLEKISGLEPGAESQRQLPSAWASRNFYIPVGEGAIPIGLMPHQEAILDYAFAREEGRFRFDTVIISCPKKSGKTSLAGLIGRWAAETWPIRFGEVIYIGNDAEQARLRGFAAHRQSVELTPGYLRSKGLLPNRWEVQSTTMKCLTTGTTCRAVALDFAGEAGANPSLTIWEELWGFVHKDALRFWAELAPSPTRADSVRLIVTYAGYEGESELLWNLYEAGVKEAQQLTNEEIPGFPDGPVPCWINPAKRIFAYWDSGISAQRMPWMLGEKGRRYYIGEAATQTPDSFRRLHLNEWTSASSSAFVQPAWWNACNAGPFTIAEGDMTPQIVALDAATSGDTFALIVGCRDPKSPQDSVRVVMCQKWTPAKGQPIDFRQPEEFLRYLFAHYNIVEVAYDPWQLADWAARLMAEGLGYFRPFNQGNERLEADFLLYQLIASRRISHDGNTDLTEHVLNANSKIPIDEPSKLRIVKRSANRHIDLCVATSMMAAEVMRLNLA